MKLKELLLSESVSLKHKFAGKDNISLYTEKGSTCELSKIDTKDTNEFLKKYKVELKEPIFYFNRLKARVERQGEGSFLMKELVKILDEKKISVINELNPYGGMNMETLEKFYAKYGFEKVDRGLMIRKPK